MAALDLIRQQVFSLRRKMALEEYELNYDEAIYGREREQIRAINQALPLNILEMSAMDKYLYKYLKE